MISGCVSLFESGPPLAAPLRALTGERPGASPLAVDCPSEGEDLEDCIIEDELNLSSGKGELTEFRRPRSKRHTISAVAWLCKYADEDDMDDESKAGRLKLLPL